MKLLLLPDKIFLILSILFGVSFIVLIRPLNTPDEANHFIRAYQISQADFVATQKSSCFSESGATIAKSSVSASVPRSVQQFTALNRDNYSLRSQLSKPLNAKEQVSVCLRQTFSNSPAGYIPQALAISLLKPFNAAPVVMDYAARIASLVAWIGLIYAAIRIIPVRKWAVLAVALLPIAVQQSISIGADILSIAPAILIVAIVLRSYYENRIGNQVAIDISLITALLVVATLAKPVMVVMIPALLLYRSNDKKSSYGTVSVQRTTLIKIIAATAPIIAYTIWSSITARYGLSVSDVFPLAATKESLMHTSLLEIIKIFIIQTFNFFFYGFSLDEFAAFGWFSSSIPQTFRYIGIASLMLVLVASYPETNKLVASKQHLGWLRIAILIMALAVIGANIFTLFIIWTHLDAFAIDGVQFRYYLPALLILATIATTSFLKTSEKSYRMLILCNSTLFFVISVVTLLGGFPARML